ncbi:MAG: glycosyltransferase [Myxococcota bacterium]
MNDSRVAVVVPAFNEAERLPRVLAGVPDWVADVVVVDDASGDGTAQVAEAWGGPVRVVRHRRNRGVGAAIATGYRAALEAGAAAVAIMAGDAQMDPGELASLVQPVLEGRCEYCKGDRTRHPEVRRRMPKVRRLGNAVLSAWTRRVGRLDSLRDAQCGYTVVAAGALRRLPLDRLYPRYGYPNDLLVMLSTVGARVLERPVTPIYAGERSGLRPWRAVVTHAWVLLRAWWWRRRFLASARRGADVLLEPEPALPPRPRGGGGR